MRILCYRVMEMKKNERQKNDPKNDTTMNAIIWRHTASFLLPPTSLSLTRMSVKERHRADQLAGDATGDDEPERPAAAAAASSSVRQHEIERRSSFER